MFIKYRKSYLFQLFFLLLYISAKGQSQPLIKIKKTYELIDNKKQLCVVDSFDRSGHLLLSTNLTGRYYQPASPVMLNHYAYDINGALLSVYNEYEKGRKVAPVNYYRTDTTVIAFNRPEGALEERKEWAYYLNAYRDTVKYLHYGGTAGELTSGTSLSLTYDQQHRIIDRKKYNLVDPLKMKWEAANYREHLFYNNTTSLCDSVYYYYADTDSLIYITRNVYNATDQLIKSVSKNSNGKQLRAVMYEYAGKKIKKITDTSAATQHTTAFVYDKAERMIQQIEKSGEKLVKNIWYSYIYY